MTEPTEITIALDLKHRAIRSANRWAVQKRLPDGTYDTLATWAGGRRSLFHWMEQHGVVPSRDAEARLAQLPEGTGFRER